MENATDALYMAAAVLLFVMAITIGITSFTSAKQTADAILYRKDETMYYEYTDVSTRAEQNRIVGLETIIPTLYKYYKENYTVVFKEAYYDTKEGVFTNSEYLKIFDYKGSMKSWPLSYENLIKHKYIKKGENINSVNAWNNFVNSKKIFSFDLDEEILRREPWTGSHERMKENLDAFINGGTYKNPNNGMDYITYDGFIKKYKNDKFVETILEYDYGSKQQISGDEEGSSISDFAKTKTKRMIIFTRIKNNI